MKGSPAMRDGWLVLQYLLLVAAFAIVIVAAACWVARRFIE